MFPPPRDRNQKRRKRKMKWLLPTCIAAVFVVLLIVGAVFLFSGGVGSIQAKEMRFTSNNNYAASNNSIFFTQDTKLTCIDYADNEKWSVDTMAADMKVAASSDLVAAYNDSNVQIFSANGQAYTSKEFYGSVQYVSCGKTLTAVLSTDYASNNRVILLNQAGEEVARYEFNDRYILDFGFTSGDSLYIYTLDRASVTPVSRVVTYNDTLANTGNLTIEGQVLQKLIFGRENLYAVGTNQAVLMDYVGTVQQQELVYGWEYRDSYASNNVTTLLFVPGGEGNQNIATARLLTLDNNDIYVQMPTGTLQVSLGRNKLYAYTANQVRTFSLNGNQQRDYALSITATSFVPLPTGQHALAFENEKAYVISLP